MKTITRGCLSLNDKIYPVYDGHNTIGRNPNARINIKNLNISHQHAIITVVDSETHYISDIKSANGTKVNNLKLHPFKLYDLNNGSSIMFGNVYCTYKKFETEVFDLDTFEATQDCSPSFYSASTQKLQATNVQDSTFNELPTQIMTTSLSVHDMPTQIENFEANDDQGESNDSIDFMTMQKTVEFQNFPEGISLPSNSAVVSECEPNPQITHVNLPENMCPDVEDVLSQIHPVQISIDKKIIDSDNSDSSTIEEQRKSKYFISDDSEETDIEQNNELNTIEEKNNSVSTHNHPLQDPLKMLTLRVSHNFEDMKKEDDDSYCATKEINLEKTKESELEIHTAKDEVPTCEAKSLDLHRNKEVSLQNVLNLPTKSTLDETGDSNEGKKLEDNIEASNIHSDKEALKENEANLQNLDTLEDTFDQPTQQIAFDFIESKDTEKVQKENDDIYIQETQIVTEDNANKMQDKTKLKLIDTDEIYMLPTQELQEPSTSKLHENPSNDELFVKPIKLLQVLKSPSLKLSLSKSKGDDEEDFFAPTQALEFLHKDNKTENISSQPRRLEDEMETLFATQSDSFMATQQLICVLEKSHEDEVIDDSMANCEKNEFLLSSQSVRSILSEGIEKDVDNSNNETKTESEEVKMMTASPQLNEKNATYKEELKNVESESHINGLTEVSSKNQDNSIDFRTEEKLQVVEIRVDDAKKKRGNDEETTRQIRKRPMAIVDQQKNYQNDTLSATKTRSKNKLSSQETINVSNRTGDSSVEDNSKRFQIKKRKINKINNRTQTTNDTCNLETKVDQNHHPRGGNRSKKKNVETNLSPQVQTNNMDDKHTDSGASSSKKINDIKKLSRDYIGAGDDGNNIELKTRSSPRLKTVDTTISFRTSQIVASTPKPRVEPIVRKSKRKNKLTSVEEDEVISISSTSTINNEVITISSTSTVTDEPSRKTRRLSANSRRKKNEEKNNQNTRDVSLDRSKRKLKPKVVFTMMNNPDLEDVISRLGGGLVDSVDACTVLVTESVKRTNKLLSAVGQSKPICSPQWLHDSKKSYSFLDPWDYIIEDKEAEEKWNFSLKESLERSSKIKLLQNYTFQLIVNTGADVLKNAIEACGGKVVTRNLAKANSNHLVIVSSVNNKNKYEKIVKQNFNIKVVESEAIYDGTLRQEFKFCDHLLK